MLDTMQCVVRALHPVTCLEDEKGKLSHAEEVRGISDSLRPLSPRTHTYRIVREKRHESTVCCACPQLKKTKQVALRSHLDPSLAIRPANASDSPCTVDVRLLSPYNVLLSFSVFSSSYGENVTFIDFVEIGKPLLGPSCSAWL